nr:hypothetical protein CFP56_43100 [Quercus suber]
MCKGYGKLEKLCRRVVSCVSLVVIAVRDSMVVLQAEWNYLELFSRQACCCSRCEGIGDCKYLHLFQKRQLFLLQCGLKS